VPAAEASIESAPRTPEPGSVPGRGGAPWSRRARRPGMRIRRPPTPAWKSAGRTWRAQPRHGTTKRIIPTGATSGRARTSQCYRQRVNPARPAGREVGTAPRRATAPATIASFATSDPLSRSACSKPKSTQDCPLRTSARGLTARITPTVRRLLRCAPPPIVGKTTQNKWKIVVKNYQNAEKDF